MSAALKSSFCISLILVIGLLIFLPRLAELPFRGEEPRRVVCAFEMWQSGNWFVPTIQKQVFFSRPPLQNWVIALTATIRGSFDHLSGRLPSVISVLLTALLIYYYCISILPTRTALLSALFFMTFPQVLQLGLTAETELMFTLLLSGSFLLWHSADLRKWDNTLKWSLAYTFLALATLTKGINQAPLYFFAIIGVYLLINHRLKELMSTAHCFGFCWFILIVGIWQWGFVHYIGAKGGWLMHLGDVQLRFQGLGLKDYLQHGFIFPFELLGVLLPWSLFFLSYANPNFWRKALPQQAKPIIIFCMSALAITIFSVWYPPGSHTRYYMPMFPCIAVLAAIAAEALWSASVPWWSRICSNFMHFILFFISLAAVLTFIWAFFDLNFLQPPLPMNHVLLYLLGSILIGLGLFFLPNTSNKFCCYVIGYALFAALTLNFIYTDTRKEKFNNLQSQVISGLKKLPQDVNLVSIGFIPHDFLYYYVLLTGKTIPMVSEEDLHAPKSSLYFCALSSAPFISRTPNLKQLVKINTGRYKKHYTNLTTPEMIIAVHH